MNEINPDRLRQVLVERLNLGASRETLREELLRRLDATAAEEALDEAIGEVGAARVQPDYDVGTRKLRHLRFSADYRLFTTLAWILIVCALLGSIGATLQRGSLFFYFWPTAAGLAILAAVEGRVHSRMKAAETAVKALFEPETPGTVEAS